MLTFKGLTLQWALPQGLDTGTGNWLAFTHRSIGLTCSLLTYSSALGAVIDMSGLQTKAALSLARKQKEERKESWSHQFRNHPNKLKSSLQSHKGWPFPILSALVTSGDKSLTVGPWGKKQYPNCIDSCWGEHAGNRILRWGPSG